MAGLGRLWKLAMLPHLQMDEDVCYFRLLTKGLDCSCSHLADFLCMGYPSQAQTQVGVAMGCADFRFTRWGSTLTRPIN